MAAETTGVQVIQAVTGLLSALAGVLGALAALRSGRRKGSTKRAPDGD